MTDPRLKKLADILVNYSVKVQPGDWVYINSSIVAVPLMNEVYKKVLQAGGNITSNIYTDDLQELYFLEANNDQLDWVSPTVKQIYEQANVLISLRGAENTRALSGVAPKKQARRAQATRSLQETYMARSATKDLRWVLTDFPCLAFAQDADMSLSDFEDFVYAATYADTDDPVAEWTRIHTEQQKVVDWLKGKKTVTVKSPNADLTLSIEGRTFINADGERNMPSGEVFTGPVEDSANGWVKYTYPAISGGREVEGIYLEFKDGKVVKATAQKNEEFLLTQLDTDEGARYLGEFAIGTNYGIKRFTKSILFDEKIGGSFHMALGAGYPETGSVNKSSIHWDMICDIREDSEIRVDGELLYKDGQFQI
ncbi:MAG TPA: aminopeptidase [Anaerolineales bacterium]|jgi:aminopeptidase|nr:aminopeptidase [Anaerolineales bacterium]